MLHKTLTLLLALLTYAQFSESKLLNGARNGVRKFPEGFQFGTSAAAYQTEGGWDADGKGENIWDYMTHQNPCSIDDCQNADISNDSYNQYKRDVEMMRELGLDVHRFSISWSRLLPTGFPNFINQAGVDYYNNLINEMLKYNITPLVTLYHWDLPQKLQLMGGLTNPHFVDWYSDYARVAFELFGDRVKHWITMNEPREICYQGYGTVTKAPLLNISGIAEYMCAKYLLVAHAKAYQIYDEEYKPTQGGKIGITLGTVWYEPETEDDVLIAEDVMQFELGHYAHPIFSEEGDWPRAMKEKIAAKSAEQGFLRSRLPEFTPEEVELIRGSSDFFGLNHYTTNAVSNKVDGEVTNAVPSYFDDIGATLFQHDDWPSSASPWLRVVPWGFYKLLTKIREDYNNPTVYITENGYSTRGGLEDEDRVSYLRQYISAMLDAMDEGSDVQMYCIWSLMDNFEWMRGYTERYGIYEVDYSSPQRTRTPRRSAFVYKEIVRSRALDPNYEPDTTDMTIDEGQ